MVEGVRWGFERRGALLLAGGGLVVVMVIFAGVLVVSWRGGLAGG